MTEYDIDFGDFTVDDLWDIWAAAGGTSAHPEVKRELYAIAARMGVHLPGMRHSEEN